MTRHQLANFKSNRGMSLISVLVAVGIMGIVALGFSTMLKNSMAGQKHVSLNIDRDAIKQMLLEAVACSKTLPTGSCTPNSILELKRSGSIPTLISNSSDSMTKFGSFTARANCSPSGTGVQVKLARLASGGNLSSTDSNHFLASPLTGKKDLWDSSSSDLFPSGVELCTGGHKFYITKDIGTTLKMIRDSGTSSSNVLVKHLNAPDSNASIFIDSFTHTPRNDSIRITSKVFLRARGRSREARIQLDVRKSGTLVKSFPLHHRVAATDNHDSSYHDTVGDEIISVDSGVPYTFNFYLVGIETGGADSATVNGYVPLVATVSPLSAIIQDF